MPLATRPPITRWKASSLHLVISAVIAVVVLFAMLLAWYPRPLFEAAGGNGLLFLLVGVDVAIGPLITLVIFRPGKRGLRFDLAVIALLQLAALAYGSYIMFAARPVYLVLVKGQLEMVSPVEIPREELESAPRPEFRRLPLTGPRVVVSELPESDRSRVVTAFLTGGADVQHLPRYYVPFAERRREALAQSQSLPDLHHRYPEMVGPIERWLREQGRSAEAHRFIPGRAPYRWFVAVLDRETGEIIELLLADPLPRPN